MYERIILHVVSFNRIKTIKWRAIVSMRSCSYVLFIRSKATLRSEKVYVLDQIAMLHLSFAY